MEASSVFVFYNFSTIISESTLLTSKVSPTRPHAHTHFENTQSYCGYYYDDYYYDDAAWSTRSA